MVRFRNDGIALSASYIILTLVLLVFFSFLGGMKGVCFLIDILLINLFLLTPRKMRWSSQIEESIKEALDKEKNVKEDAIQRIF